MTEKKALNEFISLLPMAAIIMDKKGAIIFANHIFRDKFKLSKLSKSNKIYLQNFFNFDITNIFNKLLGTNTSVSTYDYKFIDLDENEITADLHFNTIQEHKILMILQEKDNFKTYLTQASKTFSDTFMNSLSNNLGKNISSPITNIIGAIDIVNLDKSSNIQNELINIILEESNKIKDYLININQFNVNMSLDIEKANIHQCLNEALESLTTKFLVKEVVSTNYDPSIPEVVFNKKHLIKCFNNILINALECKRNNHIEIITRINHNVFIKSEELQKVLKLPIHIKIIDAGPGIDEDIEKFMFYPFITSKNNSEGLGLTYVNSVVSKYGGYLKYEREKGRSALNMFLPLVKKRSVNY
jgi:two-component system, NtrC family, nitrogen regulation sensor histidine kinase GlnL